MVGLDDLMEHESCRERVGGTGSGAIDSQRTVLLDARVGRVFMQGIPQSVMLLSEVSRCYKTLRTTAAAGAA